MGIKIARTMHKVIEMDECSADNRVHTTRRFFLKIEQILTTIKRKSHLIRVPLIIIGFRKFKKKLLEFPEIGGFETNARCMAWFC